MTAATTTRARKSAGSLRAGAGPDVATSPRHELSSLVLVVAASGCSSSLTVRSPS
jgi:hypothetical protein